MGGIVVVGVGVGVIGVGTVDRWDNKIWELPTFYFPCMNKQGRELPFFLVVAVCGLLVVEVWCVSWFWWLMLWLMVSAW